MTSHKPSKIIHPYLLGIFPIISLFSHNVEETPFIEFICHVAVALVIFYVLTNALSLLFKDKLRAAILTSFLGLVFFSYGHLCNLILDMRFYVAGREFGPNAFLYPLLLTAAASLVVWLNHAKQLEGITKALNRFGIILVIVGSIPLIQYYFGVITHKKVAIEDSIEGGKGAVAYKPDIYYIILDGYSREDMLKKIFNYNNEPFVEELRKKGFFVADLSTTNYVWTMLSVASSLNMRYLDDLTEKYGVNSDDRKPLKELIKHSRVRDFLKGQGYQTVVVSTGFSTTNEIPADKHVYYRRSLSEFQNELLNLTPLPALIRKFSQHGDLQYDLHRNRLTYALDGLTNISDIETPKFVFAHFFLPHAPFVFGPNGEPRTPNEKFSFRSHLKGNAYLRAHNDQLTYLNKRLLEIADEIIEQSNGQAVIIFQSDHGHRYQLKPGSFDNSKPILKNAFANFMAIYTSAGRLPGYSHQLTPVNLFRVILNHLFDTKLEILDNYRYFSVLRKLYDFKEITSQIQ